MTDEDCAVCRFLLIPPRISSAMSLPVATTTQRHHDTRADGASRLDTDAGLAPMSSFGIVSVEEAVRPRLSSQVTSVSFSIVLCSSSIWLRRDEAYLMVLPVLSLIH